MDSFDLYSRIGVEFKRKGGAPTGESVVQIEQGEGRLFKSSTFVQHCDDVLRSL